MVVVQFYPDPNDNSLYEIRKEIHRFSWIIAKIRELLGSAGYPSETIFNGSGRESCYHEFETDDFYGLWGVLALQLFVYSIKKEKLTYYDKNGNLVTNVGLLVRLG